MNERTEWMYCFACGSSHMFTQQADGFWKCPNCETKRKLNIFDPPNEARAEAVQR